MRYWSWQPYVPVAQRRAQAMAKMEKLRKKGLKVQPVRIEGRQIATTVWGKAWCEHLEQFSDFENRLPRGRTYVRNGSVCHLEIDQGKVAAKVSGSEIYDVSVEIKTLPGAKWKDLKARCAGKIGSVLELLRGRLSGQVMDVVTDRQNGLFPLPKEIRMDCSCPDYAGMCKHIAAVLYGVGARLDLEPEMLFLLRGVKHTELVGEELVQAVVENTPKATRRKLADDSLGEVFGIDLAEKTSVPVQIGQSSASARVSKKIVLKPCHRRPRTERRSVAIKTRKAKPLGVSDKRGNLPSASSGPKRPSKAKPPKGKARKNTTKQKWRRNSTSRSP